MTVTLAPQGTYLLLEGTDRAEPIFAFDDDGGPLRLQEYETPTGGTYALLEPIEPGGEVIRPSDPLERIAAALERLAANVGHLDETASLAFVEAYG